MTGREQEHNLNTEVLYIGPKLTDTMYLCMLLPNAVIYIF